MRRRPVIVVTVAVVALLAAGVTAVSLTRGDDTVPRTDVPSASDPDPAMRIPGVVRAFYRGGHVGPGKRVAYRFSPPIGGRHDAVWATCTGVVYPQPLRVENAVHSLEHGAVWVTYSPSLDARSVAALARRVTGIDHMLMSPYPGLERPVSLQSWGHRLMLDRADDDRIDRFITATRLNTQKGVYPEDPTATASPEPTGTCASSGVFDVDDPPPPDTAPLPATAVPDA
ncbi:DUF3105 domain-containing protein [Williamsia sp. SKLECPSW1]